MANQSRFGAWWDRVTGNSQQDAGEQASAVTGTDNHMEFNTSLPEAYINMLYRDSRTGAPYTIAEVREMASNPMLYIKQLRRWAKWAYYQSGVVSTAIDAMVSLFSLDGVVVAKHKKAGAERKSYKAGYDKMDRTLEAIRYKEVIRDALFHELNEGMYFGYFETRTLPVDQRIALTETDMSGITELSSAGMNVMVTSLPVDYTRIIGYRNNVPEIAFDLRYFDGLGEDERKRRLQTFPKQIQDGWARYDTGDLPTGATWLRLDWKKTIAVKIKSGSNDPYGVPFAVAALDDIEYAEYFIDTKRSILDTVNSQIYYEVFPEGEKKGTSALTQKQQQQQHDTVKGALTHRTATGVSFFSLAAGTSMAQLPVDISLLDEENESSISEDVNEDLGFSAAALCGSSTGNYATATLNMQIIAQKVYTWIEAIVEELNKCINYNVIRDGAYLLKFRVLPVTFLNRQEVVSYYSDLYARGKGSLIAWIAATGMNPDDYLSLMDLELDEDYENKYPVHKTSFTISGSDLEDTDADQSGKRSENPSTKSTVDNDGNSMPAPSD